LCPSRASYSPEPNNSYNGRRRLTRAGSGFESGGYGSPFRHMHAVENRPVMIRDS